MNENIIQSIDLYCNLDNVVIYKKYSCTLNQTNISDNKNKFYIMQLLKLKYKPQENNNGNNCFFHFIRYGRIGEIGKIIIKTFSNLDEIKAIISFEKQFKTKTGNYWTYRNNFVKINLSI